MGRYIARRLAGMVLLLILVSMVTFIVFNVFPSTDPAALRAGRQPSPEVIEAIRTDLGLDRPKYEQFGSYIWDVFAHQDFGRSYVSNVDVLDQIRRTCPRRSRSRSAASSSGSSSDSASASSPRSGTAPSSTGSRSGSR